MHKHFENPTGSGMNVTVADGIRKLLRSYSMDFRRGFQRLIELEKES
jgi:hypothetical protein